MFNEGVIENEPDMFRGFSWVVLKIINENLLFISFILLTLIGLYIFFGGEDAGNSP